MDLLQPVSAAAAVLLCLAATLWLLQRKGLAQFQVRRANAGPSRRLEVVERVPLSPQHVLCLVRVEDRMVLIATGPQSCSILEGEARP